MYLTPSAVKRQNFLRRENLTPPLPPLPPPPPPPPLPPPPPPLRSLLIAMDISFEVRVRQFRGAQTPSPDGLSSSSEATADKSSRTRRGGRSPSSPSSSRTRRGGRSPSSPSSSRRSRRRPPSPSSSASLAIG